MDTFELDRRYVANTYARFPVEITRGEGAYVTDDKGKRYLDFCSGIAVNAFGCADPEWIKAVTDQLSAFCHTSNLFYTRPCARLAEAVCLRTGMEKVFFSNSGAEANECAFKLARAYGEKKGKDCCNLICMKNSFHGRTLACLAATGQDRYHQKFGPLPGGFLFADPEDLDSVRELLSRGDCCAVMLEIIQGEGGVNVLSEGFVRGCAALAKEFDVLLIIDEVQTGNGRTGQLYSYMHYGIKPDVFTTAKGIGGGLPIALTVMGERAQGLLSPGDNGSTFGGNAAAAAGAYSIFSRLTDDFIAGVGEKGEYLAGKLRALPGVTEVTGRGLMIGMKCADPDAVIAAAREKGLLLLKAKDKVRILPPLTVTKEEIDLAVSVLAGALGQKEQG